MSFSIFTQAPSNLKYDNKKIINKIKIIRLLSDNNPESKKIEKLKLEIFFMMKNLVQKNINNYIKYTNNSSISDYALTSLELESEAYIILENCIKHFQYKYDFYFYFNKSLTRTFYRMFDKDKRMFDKDCIYKSELYYRRQSDHSNNDFEISLFNIGLSEEDIIVLRSKLADETKDMFFKNNPNFQTSKYYACNKKIKNILTTLKEKDEL